MAAGIVIVLIFLFCIIRGFARGGLRTFWSVGCIVAAIILSTILNPLISDFMVDQIHLDTYIKQQVEESMELDSNEDLNSADTTVQEKFIDKLSIPSSWKKVLREDNQEQGYLKLAAESFTDYVAGSIASLCVDTLAFILSFLITIIVLHIIGITFDIIARLPLLGQVNKLVGGIVGLLQGFLVIWLIMIVAAFAQNYGWGSFLLSQIMGNPLASFLYYHNLLVSILV